MPIKWKSSVLYFYSCAESLLFLLLLCSICCVEASLKANLSGSGRELASGAITLGPSRVPPRFAWLGSARPGPKLGIWLPHRDLSSRGVLMKTQVALRYFCSELRHSITRRSAASREKKCGTHLVTAASLHNICLTHRGMQTLHVVNSRRGRGRRPSQLFKKMSLMRLVKHVLSVRCSSFHKWNENDEWLRFYYR